MHLVFNCCHVILMRKNPEKNLLEKAIFTWWPQNTIVCSWACFRRLQKRDKSQFNHRWYNPLEKSGQSIMSPHYMVKLDHTQAHGQRKIFTSFGCTTSSILNRFSAFRLSSLRPHEIGFKGKWKLQWWSGSKDSQQNFTRQGCMF